MSFKKISLIVTTVVAIIGSIVLIINTFKESKTQVTPATTSQKVEINGNVSNSPITVTHNEGITESTIRLIAEPYKKDITRLEKELKNALSQEKYQELQKQLKLVKQELATKEDQINRLNITLKQSKYNVAIEAKNILNAKGIDKALEFLDNQKIKDVETIAIKAMKEASEAFLIKAQLLAIKDKYTQAYAQFEKSIQYDKNYNNMFAYAYLLQKQNKFKKAISQYEATLTLVTTNSQKAIILNNLANLYSNQNKNTQAEKAYSEALILYRSLAKQNPDVYNSYVATTLNNLAVLYSNQNKNTQAEKAYREALILRRSLAKQNPDVYGLNYAIMLLFGIDRLNQPISNLKIAKMYLQQYQNNYRANKFLALVKQLEENNKHER